MLIMLGAQACWPARALAREYIKAQSGVRSADALTIEIVNENQFSIAGLKLTPADIIDKLKEIIRDSDTEIKTIYIKADVTVAYGSVVELINKVREESGIENIGIVTPKHSNSDQPAKESIGQSAKSKAAEQLPANGELPPDLILVSVDLRDRITVGSATVRLKDFEEILRLTFSHQQGRTIFIKAPKKIPWGKMADIIDQAKEAGADPIGLQIDYLAY